MSRRLWKHRITDILDSIKKIQNYVDQMEFDDFEKDEKTIDAVIRNFIVIGEPPAMCLMTSLPSIRISPGE